MASRSNKILLWAVTIVVIVLTPLTIFQIAQTNQARADRCKDIVAERIGDRGLWISLVERSRDQGTATEEEISQFLVLLNEFKPPLKCDDQNIPVVDEHALVAATVTVPDVTP